MIRYNIIISIFLSFYLLGVNAQRSSDASKIYLCVLDNFQKDLGNDSLNLLIVDSTCLSQFRNHNIITDSVKEIFLNSEKYNIKNIHKLGKDFVENSNTSESISLNFKEYRHYSTIGQDSLNNILELTKDSLSYNLPRFYEYIHEVLKADGFCKFSSPYYFNDKFAIIYFQHSSGTLSGGGYTYILEKENGEWKIIAEIWQWIS